MTFLRVLPLLLFVTFTRTFKHEFQFIIICWLILSLRASSLLGADLVLGMVWQLPPQITTFFFNIVD
jgi:hypothetical protein